MLLCETTGFLSVLMVFCSLLSILALGSMFFRIVSATKLRYRLNESALGLPFYVYAASGIIMPSLVLKGYAMPEPKVFVRIPLSAVMTLHLLSTSNWVPGCR